MPNSTPTDTRDVHRPADPHWYAPGDPWTLSQDCWDPDRSLYFETIFSIANGYMGFRGYREEMDNHQPAIREGYLAGMFAKLPPLARKLVVHDYEWDSRQMVSLPAVYTALVTLDGEAFNPYDGQLKAYRQVFDMRSGLLTRLVEWESESGKRSRLKFHRFLSAETPNLALHRIEVEPVNWSGPVEIWWDYDVCERTLFRCGDPARANYPCPLLELLEVGAHDDTVSGVVRTIGSGHEIGISSRVSEGPVESAAEQTGLLSQVGRRDVRAGEVYAWNRYTAICTSRDTGCDKPGDASVEVLDVASVLDFEDHLKRNQAAWEARWAQSDIEIDGPARDQALVRFSIFSLLQVAPYHASNLSIPARCYAFNRYNGLYFWDGEIFLLPFYQFCQPGVARNLLEFRCSTLEGARRNAAALGASGAIFPWQGDADYGEEQAPWGLQAYLWHQNADIIYAFDQYLRATGDTELLIPKGLEVLAETARFWMSKFEFGPDGKYHLPGTVGPDEAEEHGPDNGYTSLMARRSLEIAEHWWRQGLVEGTRPVEQLRRSLDIGEDEIAEWKVVASRIHIPEVPGHARVPLQDAFLLSRKREDLSGMTVDEFWQRRGEVQVIKQADILLAMYLLEDCFTTGQIRAGYEFYEPRTLHVSSLSLNTHAIVAAISGKQEEAYNYFLRAAGLDLDNQRNATKDGLHAAALGAVWQMVTGGFMGLRVRADHLMLNPCLPEAWKRIRFSLQYRGWQLGIEADNSLIRISVGGRGQDNSILILGDKTYALGESDVIEAAI